MAYYDTISPVLAQKGQRYALLSNLFGNLLTYFVIGAMMQLYASDVLGFSPREISGILAIIPLFSTLKVFLLKPVQRIGYVRMMKKGVYWLAVARREGNTLIMCGVDVMEAVKVKGSLHVTRGDGNHSV